MQTAIKYSKYFLWMIAFLPMLIFRDYTPGNELRYLSIADEALREGHIVTFYHQGEVYADKPPLYLWIVMLGRLLWGQHSMLFLGLFSILPGFVILWIMDKWISKEINPIYRLTGQLMLLTTAFFIGAMAVLRMDMLMSMFIVLALYAFYQTYKENHTIRWWYFPLFVFLALFTKGPYGVLIPVVSVLAFLTIKKQYRLIGTYLGWRFWLILLILCVLWFGAVYMEGGTKYLNDLLFNQTVNRAVDSFSHKKGVFFYLQTIGYAAAPWSLLYIAVLLVAIRKQLIRTDLLKFFWTIFSVNFVILSLISAKLEIYLLPIYPFMTYLTLLLIEKIGNKKWMRFFAGIPALIFAFVFPVLFIIVHFQPSLYFLHTIFIYIAGAVLSLTGIWTLFLLIKQSNLLRGINSIAIGLLIALFIGSFAIPEFNSEIGYGNLARKGKQLAESHNIEEYYTYRVSRSSGMDVYLKHSVKELTGKTYQEELKKKENIILFLRNKDVERDTELKALIEEKDKYTVGSHMIVIW